MKMSKTKENLEKLEKICSGLKSKNKPLYILGHTGLCYDSLGSAMALKRIIQEYGVEGKICGEMTEHEEGYRQNTELFNKYDIKFNSLKEIEKEDAVAFVDCQPGETNLYEIKAKPIICINHHELSKDVEEELKNVKLIDIRPTKSAAAILAEYMIRKGIKLTKSDESLATIMCFGIRVDTKKWSNKGQESEHKVAPYLEEHADMEFIRHLEKRKLPQQVKKLMEKAIYVTKGEYQIGIVPKVSNPAYVSPTVDLLTQFEGYKINVVVAEVKQENNYRFIIAGRSEDPGINVNQFIQKLFKTGGGHWDAAGAIVPFAKMYEMYNIDTEKERSDLQQLADAIEIKIKEMTEEKTKTPP